MALNPVQQHALYVIPMVTGSLSAVGSSTMIYTILRSKKKLTLPHRRIMFGLSVFEVFQSLGVCTSIFPSPKDTPNTTWALGNTMSCDMQGFILTMGVVGVPLYLCSLSIYYLCIIKFNMKKKAFCKVEPFLHIFPSTYALFCGIYFLVRQFYNNAGAICYVSPKPFNCEVNPDVECSRGEGATRNRWNLLVYTTMALFVVIVVAMLAIVWTAMVQERRNKRYLFSGSVDTGTSISVGGTLRSSVMGSFLMSTRNSEASNSVPHLSAVRVHQQRDVKIQAFLYIGSYLLCYSFTWIFIVYWVIAKKHVSYAVRCLNLIFYPIQGFFNILIYCRPHVNSLRKQYPDVFPTWFSAFCKVVQSGGDSPFTPEERRRILLKGASMKVPKNNVSVESTATKQRTGKRSADDESNVVVSCVDNADVDRATGESMLVISAGKTGDKDEGFC